MVFVGDAEQLNCHAYLSMVAKLAWKTWQRLPMHTRAWLSVEDLILDGLKWAELKGMTRWNPRKATLSTVIYLGLSNYFETYYLQKYLPANQKRSEHSTTSIQAQEQRCRERGMEFEFERAFGIRVPTQKEIEDKFLNCLAVDHMLGLYRDSPKPLQQKIQEWFLGQAQWRKEEIKWYVKRQDFQERAREFRALAEQQGLTIGECRHIFASPYCLEKISRSVTNLPYSWEAPVWR